MSWWVWLAIAVAGFIGLSVVVGLIIAWILGQIARDISELLEAEEWSSSPPTRASGATPDEEPTHRERRGVRAETERKRGA